jgi:hypothetical protein
MIATLGSYDRMFGPRHMTTLTLAVQIAGVLKDAGELRPARSLLDRVVRDLSQPVNRTSPTRIKALHSLRDLLLDGAEVAQAVAIQSEIAECMARTAGPDAPETRAAREHAQQLMMSQDLCTMFALANA